jgi:hypothetical protein
MIWKSEELEEMPNMEMANIGEGFTPLGNVGPGSETVT